ncbi:hypothetical protein B0H14DRAFT_2304714, partial [Mycena olivaceomarginata]
SIAVDHLRAQSQDKNFGVACIYLDHKDTKKQTPSNLLSGLWRQLVFEKTITPQTQRLYDQHNEKRTRPSLEEIREVLCSALKEWSKVYILVDAVDECPEDQRQILLEHLAGLGPTINLMITSR